MSKFSQFHFLLKLLICVVLGIGFGYLYAHYFFELPYTSPWKYVMVAFFLPVYSITFMPILTLLKVADYKSELLFVTKDAGKNYDLHFGSLFDCILSGLFSGKRGGFKDLMLFFLVDGMLKLANDVASGKIDKEAEIRGSSYFFNEKTAAKFGFESMKMKTSHKYILYLNYLEILLVFSFSKGRLARPNIEDFRSVKTTGASLIKHKEYIEKLHKVLKRKVKL